MTRDVWAEIDLDAYRANIRRVRAAVAPASVMTVVKNDAYGHGLDRIVAAAVDEGIRFVGVLDAPVGVALRRAGLPEDVRLFAWLFGPQEDYADAVANGVEIGVSSETQLERIVETADGRPARIHAKIDTGLGRAGARPEEWADLVAAIERSADAGLVELAGVWTHIAEASDEEDGVSIRAFERAVAGVSEGRRTGLVRHLAASAASFARDDSRFDVVRVGAFGYGIAPGDGVTPSSLGLVPVLSLRARVVDLDESGGAVLSIGSVDGLPGAGRRLEAAVDGRRVSITVGLVETTVAPEAGLTVGDVVTLVGREDRGEPTLQEWADSTGTIGEEIAVRLSPRIERLTHGG
ncbi:alanine racemase [Labedella endophytica]|uniref:Alanine racemase n=1 Tax=Labedella endophytica TaxID=1523160 RepID=A0A433JRV8_9MICO|nr:alanine racemase [Labedella endophytica]RUR00767.1 alanine racemase [Labedella endophytica]